ncbi:3-carboxy-cis,cis-muconate cycloisomerase [Rhizobium deserti]|uniref:3-carboxy-cis,cis-muconate cycloisomerase n=1 Tax=Rhizobium deserti TaxID=2547961 RepID=A0A4R5UAE8_9HYPH|nr:3-carboxy-cis,cis-muconate cycloisomerase [Rhizobium deserti]TDK31780.1 3-carboxy-cis,cis-muconate cycloisomerase [Rhizobium deserti]
MSVTAFEHPFLCGLVGDEETANLLSAKAEINAMIAFEAALAKAEAGAGLMSEAIAEQISSTCVGFQPVMADLQKATGRDGVVVADLVRQLREAVSTTGSEEAARHVHFGATSQDVIDTALMMRLKEVWSLFRTRIDEIESGMSRLEAQFGTRRLMGHTRMQAAIPIAVSDRVRTWREPLARHRAKMESFSESGFVVQFGGAAGTLDKLGDKAAEIRRALALELFLSEAPQWQNQRDRLNEVASILALITGTLGKLGQDVALLAEMGSEIQLAGGGGSSAMAHKQNPVAAEVLVSLARFNAVQLSGMQHAMIHEQERSGAAWTLEWLILPPMVLATGAALRLGLELVGNIKSLGKD